MLIVYRITLAAGQEPAPFLAFLREHYLPAVNRRASRAGSITQLQLLQRFRGDADAAADAATELMLHATWSGISHGHMGIHLDDEDGKVTAKWLEFGAQMDRLGAYDPIRDE